MESPQRKRALFVGGFSVGRDGTEGGQVYACRSLIASPLSERIEWKIVDSTQRSLPPPGLPVRALDAARRLLACGYHLLFSRLQLALVFTNFSWLSLLEKGLVCIAASLLGKRTVISFRSFPLLPRRAQGAYIRFAASVCRRCDRILCQSQRAADEIVRLFGVTPEKIDVVYNWIDLTRYPAERASSLPLAPELVQMIYVGWMRDVKGVQYLVPAVAQLATTHQNFRLTMCGGGALLDDLKAETVRLGIEQYIEFRGWVRNDEIQGLMMQSDLLILPSLAEGMPNAIIQAMACSLPILSTRVTSIPEIVEDGVNGLLVEPGSADAICEGLRIMLDSPVQRQQMSLRNRQRVRERHDISTAWQRVAQVLDVQDDATGSGDSGETTLSEKMTG